MAMGESGDCTMYGPRAHNVTVEGLAQLIMGGSVRIDVACAARVLATIMESHIEVGDASHYIYHFARKQGWDIPAYPLAGCGEIKRFFAEQGVCDVPSWYVKIGVDPQRAKRLYGNTLVAVCGPDYRHVAFVLNGCYHAHDAGFTDLLHSGLIEKMSARPDTTQALERLTDRILAFELHGDTGGLPTF